MHSVPDEMVLKLGSAIDQQLAHLNIEYDQKRRSGRLHPPHIQVMAPGWSARRLRKKVGGAGRDTQFKDVLLVLGELDDDQPPEVIKELCTAGAGSGDIYAQHSCPLIGPVKDPL